MTTDTAMARRRFLRYAAMLSLAPALERLLPGYAWPAGDLRAARPRLAGDNVIDLRIAETPFGSWNRRCERRLGNTTVIIAGSGIAAPSLELCSDATLPIQR